MVTASGDIAIRPHNAALNAALTLLDCSFAHVLRQLLEERGYSRPELYEYIFWHGCQIDQTAMYRYFNLNPAPSRLPAGKKGRRFLEPFATFLGLSPQERAALLLIWQIQRQQGRKNGADRIDVA